MSKKKSKKNNSKNLYQNSPSNLDWSSAMGQFAYSLDQAAAIAIKEESTGAMIEVAKGWESFAVTLLNASIAQSGMEQQEDEDETEPRHPVGFRGVMEELKLESETEFSEEDHLEEYEDSDE